MGEEPEFSERRSEIISSRMRQFHEDLERVCSAAYVSEVGGVLITWGEGLSYTMEVSADVPFGSIREVQHEQFHVRGVPGD